jgi:hypothetical protein
MTRVYVVGELTDYGQFIVIAIFSTLAKAEKYAASVPIHYDTTIREFSVDSDLPTIT